jgi:hypothetical protein
MGLKEIGICMQHKSLMAGFFSDINGPKYTEILKKLNKY